MNIEIFDQEIDALKAGIMIVWLLAGIHQLLRMRRLADPRTLSWKSYLRLPILGPLSYFRVRYVLSKGLTRKNYTTPKAPSQKERLNFLEIADRIAALANYSDEELATELMVRFERRTDGGVEIASGLLKKVSNLQLHRSQLLAAR